MRVLTLDEAKVFTRRMMSHYLWNVPESIIEDIAMGVEEHAWKVQRTLNINGVNEEGISLEGIHHNEIVGWTVGMKAMESAGLAEQDKETGRWHLTAEAVKQPKPKPDAWGLLSPISKEELDLVLTASAVHANNIS